MIVPMAHGTSSDSESGSVNPPNLDAIDAELDAVEIALARLENGTYFTDEITGRPLDEHLLTNNPIVRRA